MGHEFDYVVIGAGSAGCIAAARLAEQNVGTVCVLEAGPSDAVVNVKVPFGLLYTMGSGRDWKFRSAKMVGAHNRQLTVNRGRMIGGSSSINSMVWFRGRQDDFDGWDVPGWSWKDVEPHFLAVEERIEPARLPDPHPISEAFGRSLGSNGDAPPTPERESAGIFHTNMRNGRRWSAADAFLRPAKSTGRLHILTNANVDKLHISGGRATAVALIDGRVVSARKGIVLSAGAIGSPSILMRSGIGPASQLKSLGIEPVLDAPGVGQNLHDHPAVGLHHAGPGSGYGLTASQALGWALSPFQWLLTRKGRMSSNFVEAGAFFRAMPTEDDPNAPPDVQVHFIPYKMGHGARKIVYGSGYFADVCVCRPTSRGALTLTSSNPRAAPSIDLGCLTDPRDLEILVAGLKGLRALLAKAPMGDRAAPEVFPLDLARDDAAIADYVKARCGTAYHPVGTVGMGGESAPVAPDLALKGIENLWVADASVMPKITSANTNAPSMMIGHKAAHHIAAAHRIG